MRIDMNHSLSDRTMNGLPPEVAELVAERIVDLHARTTVLDVGAMLDRAPVGRTKLFEAMGSGALPSFLSGNKRCTTLADFAAWVDLQASGHAAADAQARGGDHAAA